jgi:predicted transcriptional regulator
MFIILVQGTSRATKGCRAINLKKEMEIQTPDYKDHRVSENPERFRVKRLWDRHKEICRLAATGMFSQKEIAEQLGITPVTVSYTLRSPLVRHQVELLQAGRDAAAVDLLQQIEEMAPKAIALLDQALESEDQPMTTRLQAGRDLRGWMEFVLPKKKENVTIGALLSLQDIREIKRDALAAKKAEEPTVEEAQFEEV